MNAPNFTPFPELKTEKLLLRRLREDDAHELFLLRTDDRVNQYIDRPKLKHVVEASDFISRINTNIKQNECLYWAVTLIDNPKLIGTSCLWQFSDDRTIAEIGYELMPNYQGQGIMHEVLSRVIEFGFTSLELYQIDAYVHRDNLSSTKLLEKHNFQQDMQRIDSKNTDNIIFTKTAGN